MRSFLGADALTNFDQNQLTQLMKPCTNKIKVMIHLSLKFLQAFPL